MDFKSEPRDFDLGPPILSSSSNIISSVNIKSEITDAARVFNNGGLPVPSYVQHLDATDGMQGTVIKPEDVVMGEPASEQATGFHFSEYVNVEDVPYSPENALKEGLSMVASIKDRLKILRLGSKLRQEVWQREIKDLEGQGAPTTLIAVCGATGSGKSSILNAILDDNIVPTSGMRACTAVVTELSYHDKATIVADVSFLSELEWRQELEVLLHDLVDEDGNLKRNTDLKSDAGVAWQKVHAVYPKIDQERLVSMTVDQIIAHDPRISQILGTVKNIVAKDSKLFSKAISKYIDSKDKKRKKDKEKKNSSKSKDQTDMDAPAFWPLIRHVNIQCSAKALSTGAILVDLPGVADANAARNSIAKDYMKKCACIWILAPITRAVDDKTARDLLGDAFKMQLMNGNYDHHAITFIASKCDDISCSEVIRALNLEDEPELEFIEERLDRLNKEALENRKKKLGATKSAKGAEAELKSLRPYLDEYRAHLKALREGKSFKPTLTGNAREAGPSKKRKNHRHGKKGSPKRRRSASSDVESDSEDDFFVSDSIHSDDMEEESGSGSDESSEFGDRSELESGSEPEVDELVEDGTTTVELLEQKVAETREAIKLSRELLSDARKQKKEAGDRLSVIAKNIAQAQKEKNGFCSLKRSDFSREVLKEDFRAGLKDLDDAIAEERDPNNFDPTHSIRDYDAIDLPVFTCSSRDYVRLKGQVTGDGEPTCFSNVKDTGVPALQEWCHNLTISSRERAARSFLSHLKTFSASVQSYVAGIGDVTVGDREALRLKWESSGLGQEGDDVVGGFDGWGEADDDDDDDPFAELLGLDGGLGTGLFMAKKKPPKVDQYGHPIGITPHLCLEFDKLINKSVQDLQQLFKDGLEEKCRLGATQAAETALVTTDDFASSMHWNTYRATLRRHGEWRRDFNVDLVTPFTRNIAHSWSKVFESDLFAPFEKAALDVVKSLLEKVEESAAPGLKDRAKLQGDQCLEEADVALKKTMDIVRDTMTKEQKEVSRCMAPHVQTQLVEGYDRAMEERGAGSVARQKAYFHSYIAGCKDKIFEDGAQVLLGRLTVAAEAIGEALDEALGKLAQTIEVSLAVLWEGGKDDPAQIKARTQVIDVVTSIQQQISIWVNAEKMLKQKGDIQMS